LARRLAGPPAAEAARGRAKRDTLVRLAGHADEQDPLSEVMGQHARHPLASGVSLLRGMAFGRLHVEPVVTGEHAPENGLTKATDDRLF